MGHVPASSPAKDSPPVRHLLIAAACGFAAWTFANPTAAQPVAVNQGASTAAPTLMVERAKVVFLDEFNQKPAAPWQAGKGKWEVVDGALRGSELKSDMHGATLRRDVSFKNAVFQYQFKFDVARQTSFSVNGVKGHLCRVVITPTGFTVQKDSTDHGATNKVEVLDRKAVAIKPGVWHSIIIELNGKEMLASLDGEHVAFGSHDALANPKGNIGLTVAGESVSFKDFKMWEAEPKGDWEAMRAKLVAGRGKK
jgi:hypothetical protein